MCSSSAFGVHEAHALRDVGVRHRSGLWRGVSWKYLVSATADYYDADHEDFINCNSSSAWQRAKVLQIGVRGA